MRRRFEHFMFCAEAGVGVEAEPGVEAAEAEAEAAIARENGAKEKRRRKV